MDRGRGKEPAHGPENPAPRKRRKRGELHLYKRSGYWWARGTLGIRDRKFSVDQSLGLPPDDLPESRPPKHVKDAFALLNAEVVKRATWGDEGTKMFAHAALAYLQSRVEKVKAKGWATDPEAKLVELAVLHFKGKPLAAIKTADLEAFMARHFPTAAPPTQRRHLNTLGAILAGARRRDWLKAVPYIPRPPQAKRHVSKYLLPDEVAILIDVADDHIKALLVELFVQGPRGGEPLKLCWEDVDLGPRPAYVYHDTKNGEARRLPMHTLLAQWLRWERERQAKRYQRVPNGRIYVNSRGQPWHAPTQKYGGVIRKPFERAVMALVRALWERGDEERARIVSAATPHWGRHTFASLRRVAGQDRRLVQMLGGWKDQRSMDPYDHLDDELLRDALEGHFSIDLPVPPPPSSDKLHEAGQARRRRRI